MHRFARQFSAMIGLVPLLLAVANGSASPIARQAPSSDRIFELAQATTSDPALKQAQEWLVWTGYYDGPLDGTLGSGTTGAIKHFQHDIGQPETGALSADQSSLLSKRASEKQRASGFATQTDGASGIRVGIPLAIVKPKARTAGGTSFESVDGHVKIILRSFQSNEVLKTLYDEFKSAFGGTTVTYSVLRPDWFILSGVTDSKSFYLRFYNNNAIVAGFLAIYDKSLPADTSALLTASTTMMSLTIQPFATTIDPRQLPNLTQSSIDSLASVAQELQGGPSPTISPNMSTPPTSPAPAARPALPIQRDSDISLATAQRRIAELEATQKSLEHQIDVEHDKGAQTLKAYQNQRDTYLYLAVGFAILFFVLTVYLFSKLQLRAHTLGTQAPALITSSIAQSDTSAPAPISRPSHESVQGSSSTRPSLAGSISSLPIPPAILAMGAAVGVGLVVLVAIGLLFRITGL